MADGSWIPIKDVRIGDHVGTFDPATNKILTTVVVNQFVKTTVKPMYTSSMLIWNTLECSSSDR